MSNDNRQQPVIYTLYVERGNDPDDPSKPCPISRLPNGKRALFKREDWPRIKIGDTWEAVIDVEAEKYAMMTPIRQISSEPRAIDYDACSVLVDLAKEEMDKLVGRADLLEDELYPLEEERKQLVAKLEEIRVKAAPIEQELSMIKTKIMKLQKAIKSTMEVR